MQLEELEKVVERRFEREIERAKHHLRAKIGDSRELEKIARKIATKRVDRWLQTTHGMTLRQLEQKLTAPEISLEDLAVGV